MELAKKICERAEHGDIRDIRELDIMEEQLIDFSEKSL